MNCNNVSNVIRFKEILCAFSRTSKHSWKISKNSSHIEFLSSSLLVPINWSEGKSKISSLRTFKIAMLFSHKLVFAFEDCTSSGMNVGQLCGHSRLRIYINYWCINNQGCKGIAYLNQNQIQLIHQNLFISHCRLF